MSKEILYLFLIPRTPVNKKDNLLNQLLNIVGFLHNNTSNLKFIIINYV